MVSISGVRVRVPAKINLHLGVGPLRDDGFHELVTVFHAVSLYDDIVANPADELSIDVAGDETDGVPADDRNLAWRAAELLARTTGIDPRVALRIEKHIPVAGGMAGGSADAAGALLACARLWNVDGCVDLDALAAQLGSDVTFPLLGSTALGTGRGERLEPVPARSRLSWVLALSHGGISAGAAYAEIDRLRAAGHAPPPAAHPDALLRALADGSAEDVAAHLANDLQPAAVALRPHLADVLTTGRDAGALAGIVSGSGPTCAFLCADDAHAGQVAKQMTSQIANHVTDGIEHGGLVRAVRIASGPAPGASVLARETTGTTRTGMTS